MKKEETTKLEVLKSNTNEQKKYDEEIVIALYEEAIEHYKQAL